MNFQETQQIIWGAINRLPGEIVKLNHALYRITASDVLAGIPQPSFDEATRDGFVIGGIVDPDKGGNRFRIVDEIPAGRSYEKRLASGAACRIMTGGTVPAGETRVVPFEHCVEQNGFVCIPDGFLQSTATFIRKLGSEIARNELLLSGGVVLQAGHLALLASCGVHDVSVVVRPSVGYVCTGSELTAATDRLLPGQKFSSNALLIEGLLASVGARPVDMGIIKDTERELLALFARVQMDAPEVMISTGGMGPGKYDLVERAFVAAGGKVVFNSIAMRPGKSVLFGTLGKTLFFGLPGPPYAVRTLLNALAGPAILAMQGVKESRPRKVQAHLQHSIKVKHHDVLQLKEAMLEMAGGQCYVRLAGKLEMGNCFVLLPPGQSRYAEGALVDAHLIVDPKAGL